MIKQNFVIGLVCGVLSTLLVVFLAQAFKNLGSVPLRQDHGQAMSAHLETNGLELNASERALNAASPRFELASSGQLSDLDRSREPSTRLAKRYVPDCDSACTAAIRSKFLNAEDLSSQDWDTIKESGAELSKVIASDPEAIRALVNRINYSSDPNEVDGLMTLIGLFPDDMALELIRDVASYSSSHKRVALRTLSNLSMHSVDAIREIESLLISERDPQLIAAALNALETTDNFEFNDETWQGLSAQFEYLQDHQLKGAILLALAKHGKGDLQSLKHNVALGLSSDSSYLQQSSIEALGYLLSEPDNEQLFDSDGVRSQLYEIANNVDASNSVRISALHLLDESF